jgi:hypothetical protein
MLVYQRCSDTNNQSLLLNIPQQLTNEVNKSNEEMHLLRRLLNVHKHMIDVTVYFHARTGHSNSIIEVAETEESPRAGYTENILGEDKCTMNLVENTTLNEVLMNAINEFRKTKKGSELPNISLSLCRLRRYNYISNRVGETYGGRENMQLKDLNFIRPHNINVRIQRRN